MSILNLEPICARYGRQIIDNGTEKTSDKENTITKALGVLSENGLYAMAVHLVSCHQKVYGERVLTQHLGDLWKELHLIPRETQNKKADVLTEVRKIAEELPKLILARKVTENALVFARYHAKADVGAENTDNRPNDRRKP